MWKDIPLICLLLVDVLMISFRPVYKTFHVRNFPLHSVDFLLLAMQLNIAVDRRSHIVDFRKLLSFASLCLRLVVLCRLQFRIVKTEFGILWTAHYF